MSKIITENQNIIIIKFSHKTDMSDPKDYHGHLNHTLKWMNAIALEQMAYSTNFTSRSIFENC